MSPAELSENVSQGFTADFPASLGKSYWATLTCLAGVGCKQAVSPLVDGVCPRPSLPRSPPLPLALLGGLAHLCSAWSPPPCGILGLITGILADPAGVPRNSRAVDGFLSSLDFPIYIFNEACILLPHVSVLFSSFFEDDDDEVGDDEDEDDGFFVPHGYLSEDEGVTEVSGEVSGLEKSSVGGWNLLAAELGRVSMGPSRHGRSLEP